MSWRIVVGSVQVVRIRQFVFGMLLTATLSQVLAPPAAHAQYVGSLTISPQSAPNGSKFHVHGTGFETVLSAAHALDVSVFDAEGNIVSTAPIAVNPDGTIDADVDSATGGPYPSGTYYVGAFYTYWGVTRDPLTQRVICDFCPLKTEALADSVAFTLE